MKMCPSTMRRFATALICLTAGGLAAAQLPGAVDATAALRSSLTVEEALLQEDLVRYERHVAKRNRAAERLEALYGALDDAVRQGDDRLETLMQEVERAEAERTELMTAERMLVDRIREHRRRIVLLLEQVEILAAESGEATGVLTGRWEVTLLPLEQRGTFQLLQVGTLVTGTYRLEGGWTGSLQGTLVDRKVHLVRIDSKRGRSMEFEGRLSGDGKRILGDWEDYELAGGVQSAGQWSARKGGEGP